MAAAIDEVAFYGAAVLLSDHRLSFARDLVLHWSAVRDGDLVPIEMYLDFSQLQRVIPTLSIQLVRHHTPRCEGLSRTRP
jgi:hypothetical protein